MRYLEREDIKIGKICYDPNMEEVKIVIVWRRGDEFAYEITDLNGNYISFEKGSVNGVINYWSVEDEQKELTYEEKIDRMNNPDKYYNDCCINYSCWDGDYTDDILERKYKREEDTIFHIGLSYECKPCKTKLCSKCGNDQFYVGQGNYFTGVKCTKCGREECVHEG